MDDEPSVTESLRRLLKQFKHTVEVAHDGDSALNLFEQCSYDLVITDFRMPGIDGLEMARLMRQRAPQQPIVMITGYKAGLPTAGSQLPVNTVLPKPCTFEELRDAMLEIFPDTSESHRESQKGGSA